MLLCSIALSDLRLATIAPMHPGQYRYLHKYFEMIKYFVAIAAQFSISQYRYENTFQLYWEFGT